MTFDLTARGFNAANALWCAQAAQRAYAQPPTVENTKTDTQVLMETWDWGISIFHRGTTDIRGWIRDFTIRQGPIAGARSNAALLHSGFYSDVISVIYDVRRRIPDLKTPIVYGGHSKGAGEAEDAAYHLHSAGYNVVQVYTFGKPRTGNRAWAELYDQALGDRTQRVTNAADIVTWIPWLMAKYRQTGNEAWLPDIGGVVRSPSTLRKLLANGVELGMEYLKHKWSAAGAPFSDHPIGRYIAKLEALA
jgi:predicted lipase